MIHMKTLSDISTLRESVTLECKLAAGKDGNGSIPRDFWETYSAFANTHGGVILLGVREKAGTFSFNSIPNPERLKTDLFNTLNNPSKVCCNLLSDRDVKIFEIDGNTLLAVQVPQAARQQKPVFLNGNPLGNTYRRLHEGDRKCSDDVVRRMLAEQMEESRDIQILSGFGLEDLDLDTLHAYRQLFANYKPDHPWNAPDDSEFLRLIGCRRRDRHSGEEGLTLAAVLMFGTWQAISEVAPLLFWDYQELPEHPDTDIRWLDRVVADGTWSGNLFDFYRKVSRKLMEDLKVPFSLKDGIRQDDTPQHKALREALINTLVHADYSDRASMRIQKSPSGFIFRNPGTLRLPLERALKGGESDCRNRTLHQMFLMVGLGERAGSGIPKIRDAWEGHGYHISLSDSFEPYDQTTLRIETAVGNELGNRLGNRLGNTRMTILDEMRKTPKISSAKLSEVLNMSVTATEKNIKYLREHGYIKRIGGTRGYWEVVK